MIDMNNEKFGTFLCYFNCIGFMALIGVIIATIYVNTKMRNYIDKICFSIQKSAITDGCTGIPTTRLVGIYHFRVYIYLKMVISANPFSKTVKINYSREWDYVSESITYYQKIKPKAISIIPIIGTYSDFSLIQQNTTFRNDPVCQTWDEFNLLNSFPNSNEKLRNVLLGIMYEISSIYPDTEKTMNLFIKKLEHPHMILDKRAYEDYIHAKGCHSIELPYSDIYYYATSQKYIKEFSTSFENMKYIAEKRYYKVFHPTPTMIGFIRNKDVDDSNCPLPDVFYIEYDALKRLVLDCKYDEKYNYATFTFEEIAPETEEIPVMMILDY